MQINRLYLRNFRNYHQLDIQLNPYLNVIVGNNAQGKTNILEAIYMLATTKSFRASRDSEMVMHTENNGLIMGKVQKEAEHTLEVNLSKTQAKSIKYNAKDTTPGKFIGAFNVVLFTPEDLYLVKGSPSGRRRFLDIEISQVDGVYRALLSDYQKVLVQRNNLLRNISFNKKDSGLLEVWDEQLIDLGSKVILKRAEMIRKLGILSRLMHRKLSNGTEELELRYLPFFTKEGSIITEFSYKNIAKLFRQDLIEARPLEARRGYSLVGPQRDDFSFIINRLDAKVFGSQGQQRTAVLACRLGELEYMKSETGKYPVILLDDVMSELDKTRKKFLLELLHYRVQTIITTTTLSDFTQELLEQASIFKIDSGRIKS